MRVVGLDLGKRRIGVAVSDPSGAVATPWTVIVRTGDDDSDRAAIAELVTEVEAGLVVVGLPTSLDGSEGPAAAWATEEADALAAILAVPVQLHDERLTTVSANRSLAAMGVRGPARREVVDQVAATIMLQSWLDRRA